MKCFACQTNISDDSRFCSKCGTPIDTDERVNLSNTRTIIQPREDIRPGTELSGKYRIIDVIGQGGMGIVYKAKDTKLKRRVALKFLPSEMTENQEAKERFKLEAQAAAALSHPNICTIHEIGEDSGKSYIAMAGNVREWCWNETSKGRLIRGGVWNDNTFMFKALSQSPPFDRSSKNGFRCTLYPDHENIPEAAVKKTEFGETRDFYSEIPVTNTIFQVYQEQYSYDIANLNPSVESTDDSAENWIHEKVSYDAAYGGERIIGHLFLPKNTPPPYQTVIYFPGSGSVFQSSSENISSYFEFPVFLSYLVKNGRAVLYPIYKGTFERQQASISPIHEGDTSFRYSDYQVQLVK